MSLFSKEYLYVDIDDENMMKIIVFLYGLKNHPGKKQNPKQKTDKSVSMQASLLT
jgi:hypothetical protein